VHADDAVGVKASQLRGEHRAEVTAVRAVELISQPLHQLGEGDGDAVQVPARAVRRGREPEAWDRRHHHVERVRGVAAVRPRVGERADELDELHDRARPAVGEEQGKRLGLGRAHVQEVQVLPVDRGDELGELVEARLVFSPVVGGAPVLGQVP
jgi:hypothetical protein